MSWELLAPGTGWGDELLSGLGVTLLLAILGYGGGFLLGLAGALAELNGPAPLARVAAGYAAVMRSMPELLIVTLIFFGLPAVLARTLGDGSSGSTLDIGPFAAGLIALSLVQGAYTSEILRGAITTVPASFPEAARSLGLRPVQSFCLVTAPIALRYAFPGLANLWMVVIKNTALVSAVGLYDLVGAASTAGQNTKHYLTFYLAVIAIYLLLSGLSMTGQAWCERRLYAIDGPGRKG